ncbi:hypothetical protein [Magnetospirillum sp. UT-4]|uniref:hypothetical protein n=1 Tax=Magnetospirillum sp. UT-4 TaxID=2681467 RepID=UPI00137C6726|nr:hypothetical protein [Magnetospirillum sp. UT-4]CAA7612142.1 hypothetical protein MTBUT4_110071 [Magnetospirillum sp. UT-4]
MDGIKLEMWRKNGRHYVYAPQWALLVHDTDRKTALDKMDASYAAMVREYTDAGLPPPGPMAAAAAGQGPRPASSLGTLFLKTLVVSLVVTVVVGAGLGLSVDQALRNADARLDKMKWKAVHVAAERIRNNPPEQQAEFRRDLETIGGELQWLLRPICTGPGKP